MAVPGSLDGGGLHSGKKEIRTYNLLLDGLKNPRAVILSTVFSLRIPFVCSCFSAKQVHDAA